jgi:riboflavin synthase
LVAVTAPRGWTLADGASVSIDGICSTIVRKKGGVFEVEYMPETLRVTTAESFAKGRVVNLEQPLRLSGALDGHFVLGHVDGMATVARIAARGDSREITFRIPKELTKFIAHKGSIAVNGVALTVARINGRECTVALIPYTLAHTNLGSLTRGDKVNIEVDLIARYLAKLQGK